MAHSEDHPQMRTLFVREMVREFMEDHLGCEPKEIAYGTGLPIDAARRAWQAIRKEWKDDPRRSRKAESAEGAERVRQGMLAVHACTKRFRVAGAGLVELYPWDIRSDRDEETRRQAHPAAIIDAGRAAGCRRGRAGGQGR